ncbi:uncharacterized protein K02A2.6-like [Ostrea edulis]|uniref:uncharacterized protein K02A2.6-like n=1 Tax=Ostrea edulis TaxID=37623 RepID=UPI0024AFB062|nr:uncharacterized protein K02A2.6-like [Ostrea edulis]
MSLSQVKDASERDRTMQKAMEYARIGRWYEMKKLDHTIDMEELQVYRSIQDELAVHCDTVLLRGKRIILPKALRDQAIKIAHEGHQGLAKTKAFLRSKVWFPGINDRVDNLVKDCLACQAITQSKQIELLKMSELPQEPWDDLGADFCCPLPSGDYLFVIIDEYSRYLVVEIIKSVSAQSVIPVWPQANAQAEAFNKPLMKNIKAAGIERRNWKQSMFQFLRQYRTTPHSSTGISPFKLMFNREAKTKLPSVPRKQTKNDELLRQNDKISKTLMKAGADERMKTRRSDIQIGDHVLLRNEVRENKTTPSYDPVPHVVTNRKGNMITTKQNERNVTRNSSFFKKTKHQLQAADTADEEEVPDVPTQKNHLKIPEVRDGEAHTSRPTRQRKQPTYLQDYVIRVNNQ